VLCLYIAGIASLIYVQIISNQALILKKILFMQLDENFWSERYKSRQTGWDIGNVSTPIKEYFDQVKNKELKILIPGCGNAYEAEYLIHSGFKNIHVLDISKVLVDELKNKFQPWLGKQISIHYGNFFNHNEKYDLIIEQTFFCAIDPSLRNDYARKAFDLLLPGGKLIGLLFNTEFEKAGPPFGGSKEEYLKYFTPYFDIKVMEEAYNSISPRKGKELFIILVKKEKVA
jgi:methyl halide transferase